MTTDPGTDPCPATRRFVLPAAILVPVPARKLHWFAGARRMLTRPGFWVSMLALALIMAAGTVMLYGHIVQTPPPSPGTGRLYP